VSSGAVERALRDCLARQADRRWGDADPTGAELAERAVRRAHRIRRRRANAGVFALALVVSLAAAAGVVRLGDAPGADRYNPSTASDDLDARLLGGAPANPAGHHVPDPLPYSGEIRKEAMASRGPLPVDVIVAGALVTAAGQEIDLSALGGVDQAYGVADGWLLVGSKPDGRASLWKFSGYEAPKALLKDVEHLVFAPDGRRVAWWADGMVHLGAIVRDKVDRRQETGVPADTVPVGFVGIGVVLTAAEGEEYDVWWPHLGRYEPTARAEVSGVYGALPDGRTLVAQVPGRSDAEPCLALLDATAGLEVRDRVCDVPLSPGSAGWPSPDGRWLIAEGTVEASVLIDVGNAFHSQRIARDAGPGPYGVGVWVDRLTLVYAGEGQRLVRVRTDRLAAGEPDGVEEIPVDLAPAKQRILVVPQLG
jgi:hypothetical protein